ncbi:hypothetical protein LCGC14_0476360 [marine sediment metagenome]|uniref:Uncharacterized protein n=1 Tax=marine sediment metagenome TaxID=412755 RepID=A0A0F9VJD2_9ZZZZ|nr:hypothetical protein [bacterium]
MVKLRQANINELREGDVIYFEYEHNYNGKSRAMRYKRGLFLCQRRGKAILILQGLHGNPPSWNKFITICDFDRICIESHIGTAEFVGGKTAP